MMNIFQRIAIIALAIFGTSVTNGEVGQICQMDYECPGLEICRDGSCNCKKIIYNTESVPVCERFYHEKPCFRDKSCMPNSKCIENRCECNEGYQRFIYSCRQVKVQGLMMSCGNVDGQKTEICDISKKIICQSKICVCSLGYVPNHWGLCEEKSTYIARNELTEYRVKPGFYCRKDEECIDGLHCKNFTCLCPSECKYESKKEVCDCGEVDDGTAHIYTGIFLGLLIVIFWYKITKSTIKKHKNLRAFRAIPVDLSEPPSYSLSPVRTKTTETASTAAVGLQFDNLPVKQEKNPPPPEFSPQPQLPYPIKPTVENLPSSDLGPPPPYSLVPTATDPPFISSPASNVFPPYEIQPAYNPYHQDASNTGSADNECKLNKQS